MPRVHVILTKEGTIMNCSELKMELANIIGDSNDGTSQIIPSSYKKRNRKRESKKKLCNTCGEMVTNYVRHIKTHECEHTCNQCFLSFKSEPQLKAHLELHNSENPFICDTCNLKFTSVTNLAMHNYTHTQKYICPICGFHATSKKGASLKVHISRHEDKFKFRCELCGKGFFTVSQLQNHLDVHEGVPKYECDLCHKKFAVKNYLKLHIQFNHKKEVYGIEESFQCEHCGRKFSFEKSFHRHLSTVHRIGEDLRAECPVCYKTISNKYSLKKHMRIHTGEKNYACEKCGKRFSQAKYVKKHQSVHLRETERLKRKS